MTNADRIRSMSDEELRDLIDHIAFECDACCAYGYGKGKCIASKCKDGITKWLKSEVADER